jgi:hypothetical protein
MGATGPWKGIRIKRVPTYLGNKIKYPAQGGNYYKRKLLERKCSVLKLRRVHCFRQIHFVSFQCCFVLPEKTLTSKLQPDTFTFGWRFGAIKTSLIEDVRT